jgi:hypothetical protein
MFDRTTQHLHALASPRRLRVELQQGQLRSDDAEISAIYVGNGTNADYLSSLLFATVRTRQVLQEIPPLSARSTIAKLPHAVDVVLCERAPLWAALGGTIDEVRMPAWIRQELPLIHDGRPWMLGRHREREAARLIRRHGFRIETTNDGDEKKEFFEKLYSPYLTSRHGPAAVVVDRNRFSATAAGATLVKLFAGDDWVAGMLLHWRGSVVKFGWYGANIERPYSGASEMLDVLCIRMASQRGATMVNFGHSRPSLADGVVRYKRKFGTRTVLPSYPQSILEIQLRNSSKPLLDWLNQQQFICIRRSRLVVAEYRVDSCGKVSSLEKQLSSLGASADAATVARNTTL